MSNFHLAALSPADLAILFEPNPYSYDSTVTDPSQPLSPFVQVMHDQEQLFFAAFPEAKKAAEYRERRKEQLRAFLASKSHSHDPQRTFPFTHTHESHIYDDVPQLVPAIPVQSHTYLPPRQDSHHRVKEEFEPKPKPQNTIPQQQEQPHSPTHHDLHPQKEHHSASQHTNSDKPTKRDRSVDHVNCPSKSSSSTPKPSYTPHPRKKNSNSSGPKRRVAPLPGKRRRQRQPHGSGKPTLACLFCRGRKIACGAPLPGSIGKTCNQCQRRSLQCEFPAENRRGMRKRQIFNGSDEDNLPVESILSP